MSRTHHNARDARRSERALARQRRYAATETAERIISAESHTDARYLPYYAADGRELPVIVAEDAEGIHVRYASGATAIVAGIGGAK
jgi:hypothetical protein